MNFYEVSARLGIHSGSIGPFFVSGKNPVYRKNSISDNGDCIYYKNGILQFGKDKTSPQSINVLSVSGKIVHKGMCLPGNNAFFQYRLPSTLQNGFYVIKTSAHDGNAVFPCMIMK